MTDKEPVASPSRVLLVDGNPEGQTQLLEGLKGLGVRLSLAQNGQQGYERAIAAQPDIILTDLNIPLMDGMSMLRLLKSNPMTQDIPVIVFADQPSLASRLDGFREGAVDFISRPFDVEEVLARVSVHLAWLSRVRLASLAVGATLEGTGESVTVSDQEVLVRAVQKHILDHLAESPSVAELAQVFSVSERRLSLAFKSCLDMSVFAYTRQERMRKAQHLLANTGLSMDVIALEVGFSSAANFSTAFHVFSGTTPTAYRNAAHEQVWREMRAVSS